MAEKTGDLATRRRRRTLTEEGERLLYEIFHGHSRRSGAHPAGSRAQGAGSRESGHGGEATTTTWRPPE